MTKFRAKQLALFAVMMTSLVAIAATGIWVMSKIPEAVNALVGATNF